MFKNEEGFSLLELVVAVGVAGIIAAVALPTFAGLQDKATTTSATYAASASAAEALANSTIGTSGSVNSGASSSQAPAVTITGLTIAGYNNQQVLWSPAVASNGESITYTLTSTLTGEVIATLSDGNATTVTLPSWNGTFQYASAYSWYVYAAYDSNHNHYGDITITASIASNPSVTQVVNG